MKWPKIFTVPDGPFDMCRFYIDNGHRCRCAGGWVDYSIPFTTYPDAVVAFRTELRKRMLAKVQLRSRKDANSRPIEWLNDNHLTLTQSAEAVQETAAHFGFTENA